MPAKSIKPFKISAIATTALYEKVKSSGIDLIFGLHFIPADTSGRLIWMDIAGNLHIFSVSTDREIGVIKFYKDIVRSGWYAATVQHDTIHYVDLTKKKYYGVKLSGDSTLMISDSFDLKQLINLKEISPTSNMGLQSFAFHYPYLLIPYQHLKRKFFYDKTAYLKIDLRSGYTEKVIPFPDCYQCNDIYEEGSYVSFKKDGSVVCVFQRNDNFLLADAQFRNLLWKKIIHPCEFKDFDIGKRKNLAYVRKYLFNGEANMSLVNIADENFIVIKKERKQNVNDTAKFSFFLFDDKGKQEYSQRIAHSVHSSAIFAWDSSLIIFNDSLSCIYKYEIVRKN